MSHKIVKSFEVNEENRLVKRTLKVILKRQKW